MLGTRTHLVTVAGVFAGVLGACPSAETTAPPSAPERVSAVPKVPPSAPEPTPAESPVPADGPEARLRQVQHEVGEKLLALGVTSMSTIEAGRVRLEITDRKALDAALAAENYVLPPEVDVVAVYEPVGDRPPFPVNPDPTIFFPQFRMRSPMMMTALLEGTLSVVDGCLRVTRGDGSPGHVVIWQPDHYLHRKGKRRVMLDREGKIVARVGEHIAMSGGLASPEGVDARFLKQPIPARCKGPYFEMGALMASP
ncbi:hypothetical protein SAMN02745121_05869 [Nannocystis exedens]|uniref:Uncharacterized protein n=1 Tax=Nannocystis exedens TaxID=54 RepID=A0A1I2E1I1_9BACT|nr:hypothetical protein [Nannocystis exedens]PCC69224.1 hypothetical protein NAEX_02246 [Nannocystis exedens]SFE86754.1 hypothetical protein SAMN02745121_05869 [Nannocystis exedens]